MSLVSDVPHLLISSLISSWASKRAWSGWATSLDTSPSRP